MKSYQYEISSTGSYVLRDEKGKMLINTTQPAILFDRDTGTIHKHGDYKVVLKIAQDMKAKYARVGAIDLARDLVLYTSKTFDVAELNRCLSTVGYCKALFTRISSN